VQTSFWTTDPDTLCDEIVDRAQYNAAFAIASDEDLIWLLGLDKRLDEAEAFGRDVIAHSGPRFQTLLHLARVLILKQAYVEAANFQARALLQARTVDEQTTALHSIGLRLFHEGQIADALVSFEESRALILESAGSTSLAELSTLAINRCQQLIVASNQS